MKVAPSLFIPSTMQVSPNHVWYSRPPAKLHNRSIIPPHARQMSCLWLTAYRVDDKLSDSLSSDSSPTPGTSTPVSQGMRGTSFLHMLTKHHTSNSLLIMSMIMLSNSSSSDSLPTLGTSMPVSQGMRGTSFLHTLTKHHTSDSLLIMSMIMLTHHYWILRPHQVLPRLSPRGQGGRVSSTCSPNITPLTHCLLCQW